MEKYEEKSKKSIDEKLKKIGRRLDRHYTASRYPDVLPNIAPKDVYDKDSAKEILKNSSRIIAFCERNLKEEE